MPAISDTVANGVPRAVRWGASHKDNGGQGQRANDRSFMVPFMVSKLVQTLGQGQVIPAPLFLT